MKPLKILLFVLIGLPILLVLFVGVLILTIDPNVLKPRIEAALQEHGILADFAGDIDWQLFPTLGLRIEDLKLKNAAKQPLIDLGVLDAGVELSPLFRKQIVVDSILLKDATVHYIVNTQNATENSSNWSAVGAEQTKPSAEPEKTDESNGDSVQNLNVQVIDISDLAIRYLNAPTGERSDIEGAFFRSENINLSGKPFAINLGMALALEGLPKTVLAIAGELGVDQASKQAQMSGGVFSVKPGKAAIEAKLDFTMNWEALAGEGTLNITPTKIKPLLEALGIPEPRTRNPKAVDALAGSTHFAFTDNSFELKNTQLTLDDFTLKGYANVSAFQPLKVKSEWQGSAINLDHYLPPKTEQDSETEIAEVETPTEPLPLQTIRDIDNVDVRINIDEVIVSELPIQDIQLTAKVNNGIARSTLKSQAAAGNILANTNFDARGKTGKLTFDAKTQGIDVGKLLAVVTEKEHLQGAVSSSLVGNSAGATNTALVDNIVVNAEIQSEKVTLTPINIEQEVCKAIAAVQKKTMPEYDWPQRTELSPVTTKVKYAKDIVNVQSLQASIAHFKTQAEGSLNLDTGKFEFPLELSIADFASQLEGCFPISEKWRKISFPILCEGKMDNIDYKTCLPNTKKLGRVFEQRVKNEAKQKIEEKKDKAEDKLKEKLKDKLGEEKTKELKGLFDSLRGK